MTHSKWFKTVPYTIKKLSEDYPKTLYPNPDYQRSKVWKLPQKKSLLDSIFDMFPIGAIVLYEKGEKYDILDGQQRIHTIHEFIKSTPEDKKPVTTSDDKFFRDLSDIAKIKFLDYEIPAIVLYESLSKDEISSMFIRLQQGSPLSTAEKVYAFRGKFRDTFVNSFFDKQNNIFFSKLSDQRFRARLVAAHLFTIELESNYDDKSFPDITFNDLEKLNEKYKKKDIPNSVINKYNNNLQFIGKYLNPLLGKIRVRELTPVYTLVSYYNQKGWLDRPHIGIMIRDFTQDLVEDLGKFSIYSETVPDDMTKDVFGRLMKYKAYSRQGLTGLSLKERFEIMDIEFKERKDKLSSNTDKLKSREKKISLYYAQEGQCPTCSELIKLEYVDNERLPIKPKKSKPSKTQKKKTEVILHASKRTIIDSEGSLVHVSCIKIS